MPGILGSGGTFQSGWVRRLVLEVHEPEEGPELGGYGGIWDGLFNALYTWGLSFQGSRWVHPRPGGVQ